VSKQTQSDVATASQQKLAEPRKYAVLMLNDDYTTMEFVIDVLQRFFQKTEDEAVQVMMKVHQEGKGIAGVYSLEIAEMKVMQVTDYARSKSYPLKCSIEPIGS